MFGCGAHLAGVGHLQLVPYMLRHGGASHDALAGRRSIAAIKKRGRWRSDQSLRRYQKESLAMAQLMGAGGSGATGGSTGSSGSGSSGKSSSSASAAAQQSAVNQMYELQRQASEQLQLQYLRDLMPSGGGLPSSWHHQGKK